MHSGSLDTSRFIATEVSPIFDFSFSCFFFSFSFFDFLNVLTPFFINSFHPLHFIHLRF